MYFKKQLIFWLVLAFCKTSFSQNIHIDKPFPQDYSIKYYITNSINELKDIGYDRNGNVKILANSGILKVNNGRFLYPGNIISDDTYRPFKSKKISALISYENQFVFLDDKAILSNAWAGSLYAKHTLTNAKILTGGSAFEFLISDGTSLQLLKDSKVFWSGKSVDDEVLEIKHQAKTNTFWILGRKSIQLFSPKTLALKTMFSGSDFTSFDFVNEQKIWVGTMNGYQEFDLISQKKLGELKTKLPSTDIKIVRNINGKMWFGTSQGAFCLNANQKYDYYFGERWLPDNDVIKIEPGPENSVLILTKGGLGQIYFKNMTLAEKADMFETQVRSRHIRNGFNASLDRMEKGNIETGYLADSDNDGLWTSMYLGGEIFKYAVTKDKATLQNCRESLDAMERLYTINGIPGFPSRSYERSGLINQLADPERWQHAPDPEWDWKSTTSSDEVIGHIFAFGAMAELIPDKDLKARSIVLIDTLMSHILKNNMYLIDFDGKPTLWGKWNPEYVNAFPINVGDRKLNSSNIVAMLQTAYHFTKKEKYKQKAIELMTKYGYLENLKRPMNIIGKAPEDADDHAKNMSDGWNHSDDEMYFLGYWGLYRYALNDTLKQIYKKAIIDHWQAERPEKEGLWNIFTAVTKTPNFDLKEAVWYLQEHPLDLIDWNIKNSHRKDIEPIAPNFRRQTLKEVLPPDERPVQRHNGNMFNLDRNGGNGLSEHSAGDIWLLPYWMGRYLGVISGPQK